MRVNQRLRHGFTAVTMVAALVTIPGTANGQIVTASEPYASVESNASDQTGGTPTAEISDLDFAFLRVRQAIAYGDVSAAESYLQQATQINDQRSQLGETREVLRALIDSQLQLSELANRDPDYNTKAANFLIQQASSILKFRDFETAEMLLEQANKFPVDFASLPLSPDTVVATILQAKNGSVDSYSSGQLRMSDFLRLMSQAEFAFDKGDLQLAHSLTTQAKGLGVADAQLPANQTLPWQLELKIQDAMQSNGNVVPASFENAGGENVIQADYDPATDTTKNVQVSATLPLSSAATNTATEFAPIPGTGMRAFDSGMTSLKSGDLKGAREFFELAWQYRQQLDAETQQTLQDQLTSLPNRFNTADDEQFSGSNMQDTDDSLEASESTNSTNSELITEIGQQEQFRKLQSEIFRQRAAAEQVRGDDPRAAIDMLVKLRKRISDSEISDEGKRALFTMVERDIADFQKFVQQNLSEIQLKEDNAAVLDVVREGREKKYNTEHQIQKLVDDFNGLMEERRFAEADMVARQAYELAPDSEIVALLRSKASIAINDAMAEEIRGEKADAFTRRLADVDRDSINNVSEDSPLVFGDADIWGKKSRIRDDRLSSRQYRNASERKIWNALKNEQVQGHYQGTLTDAIRQLAEQSGINIYFDSQALAADSVSSSSSVDVPIIQPIKLESALNIILSNAGLVFVVEDEVIKVTSKDAQRRDVKPKTYYVGDLVTPIQNFQNSLSMNFMTPGGASGGNGIIGQGGAVPLANHNSGTISPVDLATGNYAQPNNVLAQQLPGLGRGGNPILGNFGGGGTQTGTPTYNSIGPQALGGVTEADFLPLINLIRNTIDPEGWQDTNGDGTVQAFVPNLSLIVSQTQQVQDQIQDLLLQLRELNDVQIVVEVRFVSLSDQFFERIGIDFDFNLNDNSGLNPAAIPERVNPSSVVGLVTGTSDATPTFSPDLDIPFQQTNFLSTIPSFGGFDPGTAANFGFAILSDIEVFFLIQASKGDTRTNITQAPTVTMFNGQVASVTDGATVPFVTSVTPVVGDFAVAQQPIITLLPEGANLNVQAVVSNDRKSVRMTLVPFFSQITNVENFTFDGSTTTQRATDENLIDDLLGAVTGQEQDPPTEIETTTQGVTIQLPTLGFTSVSTVVSVPDGGTILLGGVKRQTEQRVERGVPFLSNVPYVSRLFKNVGIGRETSSLMMMVTPRIIIQEEEELEQVGTSRN